MAETKLPPGMQAADAVIDAALESGLVADLKAAVGNRDWDWAAHVAELEAERQTVHDDLTAALAEALSERDEARATACPWCHRTGRPCPATDYDAGRCQKPEGHDGSHYSSTGSIAVNWPATAKETP